MIFTKFHENRLIIDGEINEKHALSVECGPGQCQGIVYIVAVNFHQRWVFFADFSVDSKSISMKFCKHCFQLFRRLP